MRVPPNYLLGDLSPLPGPAQDFRTIVMTLKSAIDANGKVTVSFDLSEPDIPAGGVTILRPGKNGMQIRIINDMQLTFVLDDQAKWYWNRTGDLSPLTTKLPLEKLYGGIEPYTGAVADQDNSVTFFAAFNTIDPKVNEHGFNFNVIMVDAAGNLTAVSIDPMVVNPPLFP